MPNTTISPNMLLPVPVVGVDPGPQYATDVNSCLSLIDSHDHSPGYGIQITPAGININSDLSMNINNLTNARTVRFSVLSATPALVSDVGCLYEKGIDLYYIDGAGTNIRITSSGGVAGTPGSIANLVAPASAAYVAAQQKFVWQQDSNKAATMDFGSAILRNLTTSSFGLTLSPPAAMAGDISITLPTIPPVSALVSMDSAGNMSTHNVIISGTFDGSATILSGTGFSVMSSGTGFYIISFNHSFVTAPAVTVSTISGPAAVYVQNIALNTTNFQVTNLAGSAIPGVGCSFIAVGTI